MGRAIKPEDKYYGALMKAIPSEMIGIYLLIRSFIAGLDDAATVSMIVVAILIIVTVFWIREFTDVKAVSEMAIRQPIVSAISMGVWSFALEDPWTTKLPTSIGDNMTAFIPIILIIWTGLLAPLVLGRKPGKGKDAY